MPSRTIFLLILILAGHVNAAGVDTPMESVLCTVADWFTGNTGKGLATIAVIILGNGALLGKVSWGMALTIGVGIAVLFGASGIVDALAPGTIRACQSIAETL